MSEDRAQMRRRWEVLFETWAGDHRKAQGALAALRMLEKGAAAGANPRPTAEEEERVEGLIRLAEARRREADEFVHRLFA